MEDGIREGSGSGAAAAAGSHSPPAEPPAGVTTAHLRAHSDSSSNSNSSHVSSMNNKNNNSASWLPPSCGYSLAVLLGLSPQRLRRCIVEGSLRTSTTTITDNHVLSGADCVVVQTAVRALMFPFVYDSKNVFGSSGQPINSNKNDNNNKLAGNTNSPPPMAAAAAAQQVILRTAARPSTSRAQDEEEVTPNQASLGLTSGRSNTRDSVAELFASRQREEVVCLVDDSNNNNNNNNNNNDGNRFSLPRRTSPSKRGGGAREREEEEEGAAALYEGDVHTCYAAVPMDQLMAELAEPLFESLHRYTSGNNAQPGNNNNNNNTTFTSGCVLPSSQMVSALYASGGGCSYVEKKNGNSDCAALYRSLAGTPLMTPADTFQRHHQAHWRLLPAVLRTCSGVAKLHAAFPEFVPLLLDALLRHGLPSSSPSNGSGSNSVKSSAALGARQAFVYVLERYAPILSSSSRRSYHDLAKQLIQDVKDIACGGDDNNNNNNNNGNAAPCNTDARMDRLRTHYNKAMAATRSGNALDALQQLRSTAAFVFESTTEDPSTALAIAGTMLHAGLLPSPSVGMQGGDDDDDDDDNGRIIAPLMSKDNGAEAEDVLALLLRFTRHLLHHADNGHHQQQQRPSLQATAAAIYNIVMENGGGGGGGNGHLDFLDKEVSARLSCIVQLRHAIFSALESHAQRAASTGSVGAWSSSVASVYCYVAAHTRCSSDADCCGGLHNNNDNTYHLSPTAGNVQLLRAAASPTLCEHAASHTTTTTTVHTRTASCSTRGGEADRQSQSSAGWRLPNKVPAQFTTAHTSIMCCLTLDCVSRDTPAKTMMALAQWNVQALMMYMSESAGSEAAGGGSGAAAAQQPRSNMHVNTGGLGAKIVSSTVALAHILSLNPTLFRGSSLSATTLSSMRGAQHVGRCMGYVNALPPTTNVSSGSGEERVSGVIVYLMSTAADRIVQHEVQYRLWCVSAEIVNKCDDGSLRRAELLDTSSHLVAELHTLEYIIHLLTVAASLHEKGVPYSADAQSALGSLFVSIVRVLRSVSPHHASCHDKCADCKRQHHFLVFHPEIAALLTRVFYWVVTVIDAVLHDYSAGVPRHLCAVLAVLAHTEEPHTTNAWTALREEGGSSSSSSSGLRLWCPPYESALEAIETVSCASYSVLRATAGNADATTKQSSSSSSVDVPAALLPWPAPAAYWQHIPNSHAANRGGDVARAARKPPTRKELRTSLFGGGGGTLLGIVPASSESTAALLSAQARDGGLPLAQQHHWMMRVVQYFTQQWWSARAGVSAVLDVNTNNNNKINTTDSFHPHFYLSSPTFASPA